MGCYIHFNDNSTFFADEYSETSAIMKLDGKKIIRKLKSGSSPLSAHETKKDDEFTSVSDFGAYMVELKAKVTSVCQPDSKTCELTEYTIDISVSKGKEFIIFENLLGECGA